MQPRVARHGTAANIRELVARNGLAGGDEGPAAPVDATVTDLLRKYSELEHVAPAVCQQPATTFEPHHVSAFAYRPSVVEVHAQGYFPPAWAEAAAHPTMDAPQQALRPQQFVPTVQMQMLQASQLPTPQQIFQHHQMQAMPTYDALQPMYRPIPLGFAPAWPSLPSAATAGPAEDAAKERDTERVYFTRQIMKAASERDAALKRVAELTDRLAAVEAENAQLLKAKSRLAGALTDMGRIGEHALRRYVTGDANGPHVAGAPEAEVMRLRR